MSENVVKPIAGYQPHSGPVLAVCYDVDGEYVISGGQDKNVILSQPSKGKVLGTYTGHTADVLCVVSSSDHRLIFSSGIEKSVFVWDVSTFRVVRKFHGHESKVNAVSLFPQSDDIVVSGSYDSSVRIWDLRSSQRFPLQILKEAKDSISSLSIHQHPILVSGSYDIRKGILFQASLHVPITDITYRSDTNVVVVSTLDSTLRLVDLSTGLVLVECYGHTHSSMKCSHALLSPSDKTVWSGSEDGFLYGWDFENATTTLSSEQRFNFKFKSDHLGSMNLLLKAHPSNPAFVSGSLDGTIRIFNFNKESD